MKKRFLILPIIFLALLAVSVRPAAAASNDPLQAIQEGASNFLSGLWDAIYNYIVKPLMVMVGNAINTVIGAIGDAFRTVISALTSAITTPVYVIQNAWYTALNALNSVLGPLSFLSPLILTLLFVAAAAAVYYLFKFIVPGI